MAGPSCKAGYGSHNVGSIHKIEMANMRGLSDLQWKEVRVINSTEKSHKFLIVFFLLIEQFSCDFQSLLKSE